MLDILTKSLLISKKYIFVAHNNIILNARMLITNIGFIFNLYLFGDQKEPSGCNYLIAE